LGVRETPLVQYDYCRLPYQHAHRCVLIQAKKPEEVVEGGGDQEEDEGGEEQGEDKGEEGADEEGCGKEVEYEFTRWEERVLEVPLLPFPFPSSRFTDRKF